MNLLPLKTIQAICCTAFLLLSACEVPSAEKDAMYSVEKGSATFLAGTHHLIFEGVKDESGYNNHVYLAHYKGLFWAIWSSSKQDGGHTGQKIRYATSKDGVQWSSAKLVSEPSKDEYLIARGLWLKDGELFALVARCTGTGLETKVQSLDSYQWSKGKSQWKAASSIGKELINNYAPIRLKSGAWLMPYRFRELNRVDGVLLGGEKSIATWKRVPLPSPEQGRFTEANAVVRKDGSIAIHLRDNQKSGYLFRSVSLDDGKTFSEPKQTNFPDCRCKHYCFQLSHGLYVLINNPKNRKDLRIAGSPDGKQFTRLAVLRNKPQPVRNPGHDKSPSFTYPHAIEHDGFLYIAYASNRDDISITRISLEEVTKKLGR